MFITKEVHKKRVVACLSHLQYVKPLAHILSFNHPNNYVEWEVCPSPHIDETWGSSLDQDYATKNGEAESWC